ncbi:CdaR family protein [uncultured Croceitalea sp.]|uniref:CdaR family protein n=1 Tax=uncultured Croceitalea sp. TaxID=1798908 RepID=UPI00374F188B
MLRKIINELHKRKVKVFLLFLLCSILAWSVSKFSDSYESRTTFKLKYEQFPDSLLLNNSEVAVFVAKLRASGFQFLSYGLNQKEIKVDLQQIENNGDDYFLTANELKIQMERQLSNTVSLLELEKDTFFIDLYKVVVKEIPIKPNVTIGVAPNHLMEGELELNPKTATIKGPSKEVSKIDNIVTDQLVLSELSGNFSEELILLKPELAKNAILLTKKVEISGKIVEFSEREFNVTIDSKNLPKGYGIKIFPNKIELVCKASIDALKSMKPSDFKVVVDYQSLTNTNNKYLNVRLVNKPENAYSVRLLTNRVEFVLEKL